MLQSPRGLQRGFASSMMEVQTPQQQAGFLAVWPQDRQAHLQLQQLCRQKTLHWQGLLSGLPLAKNGFLDGESATSAVYLSFALDCYQQSKKIPFPRTSTKIPFCGHLVDTFANLFLSCPLQIRISPALVSCNDNVRVVKNPTPPDLNDVQKICVPLGVSRTGFSVDITFHHSLSKYDHLRCCWRGKSEMKRRWKGYM